MQNKPSHNLLDVGVKRKTRINIFFVIMWCCHNLKKTKKQLQVYKTELKSVAESFVFTDNWLRCS